MSPARPRVVVVGGGVIGCAVAWRLARRNAGVTLIERDEPGARASTAAAGMLSPLKEAEKPGPFLDMGLLSLDRYPSFVEAVESTAGFQVGYRKDGRLDVALDTAGAEALRHHQRVQTGAGYESRLLEPAELRRLEPEIGPDAVLGLATEHDHQLDNLLLMQALRVALAAERVDVRAGERVSGIEADPGRVTAVRLDSGERVAADFVVVAAGAWTGQLDLPMDLRIRPVRGQIVILRSVPPVLGRTTWGPGLYLVPRRDGRVIVGASMEEVGFRPRVTAGPIARLLDRAVHLVPHLADADIDGFQVGLRPASPDGLPVIGRDPSVEGLVYATGHFRNGVLLAPETAERVAAIILDDAPEEPAFSPARLAAPHDG